MIEFLTKLNRIRKYCLENSYDGMYLSSRANFAWLTCGGNNTVERCNQYGVADLFVCGNDHFVVASEIERYRIWEEELARTTGFQLVTFPWGETHKEDVLARLVHGKKVVSDVALPGMDVRIGEIAELRYVLTDEEEVKVRASALAAAVDLENIARSIAPGMSEYEVAAMLMSGSVISGCDAPVVLVAFDERMNAYRHPAPTGKRLAKKALLARCSEQAGLIVSVSRIVSFGQPDDEFRRRHQACAQVNAAFIAATVTGARASEIFAKGIAAYVQSGHADEWTKHHQGGALGYACRDYVIDSGCTSVVRDNQLFSWNPSISGTKIEDTIITKGDRQEILTDTKRWPRLEIRVGSSTIQCPDILVR